MGRIACWTAGIMLMWLTGCASHITIKETPGVQLPGRMSFRMNYAVHDPDGRVITDEVIENELDRWLLFTELAGAVRAAFEDRGYKWVYDPLEPADFVVDVGFSAFYSEKVTREQMERQRPATLMVGGVKEGRYLHMVVISVLARPPERSTDGLITVWEARGIRESTSPDVRVVAFPLIAEIVERFPRAAQR